MKRALGARLKADLDKAWQQNVATCEAFALAVKNSQSAIAQHDGNLPIKKAREDLDVAIRHHVRALHRYTHFVAGSLPAFFHKKALAKMRAEAQCEKKSPLSEKPKMNGRRKKA